MQMRSKAYLRFVWLWRLIRGSIQPYRDNAPARTSRALACTAIVLALLLVALEIDRHSAELESTNLVKNGYLFNPAFVGP